MILRRIIAHFRKQEWTAIGIDFVIVVVGVFVGIQVANWNAEQADGRRGAHYVERLSRDLEEDLVARRGEVAYYGAVLDSVVRANALLADARSDPEALVVGAYRATEVTYRPPTRSTWDEIVSSGDIGLLSRQAVDSGIADYYASDTSLLMLESLNNSDYRRAVRRIIPLEVQMAIRAGCSDARDEAQQIVGFMEQCVLDVDDAVSKQNGEHAARRCGAARGASISILARVHCARQSERRRGLSGARARGAARRASSVSQPKFSCQVTPKRSPTQAKSSLKP